MRRSGGRFLVKEVYFFTQMGYTAYPQDKAKEAGYSNLLFSNKHFSPERASELYGMYFRRVPARLGKAALTACSSMSITATR